MWERRLEEVEGELGTRRIESKNFSVSVDLWGSCMQLGRIVGGAHAFLFSRPQYKVEALERALQLSNTDTSAANEELVRTNKSFIKYRSTKVSSSVFGDT